MSDTQRTERVGDEDFKVMLRDMIPHMRAFARGLTGDASAADDLAQDALLRAWDRRQQFAANTNFRAWILTIVRNQFYSDKRRSWRSVQLDEEKAKRTLPSAMDLDGVMELDDVRRALKQLSEDHREALLLVGAGGYSYQEAADICECAVGTIKSRVNRARATLVEILEVGPEAVSGGDGVSALNAADEIIGQVARISNCQKAS